MKLDWSKWPKGATHVHDSHWKEGPCSLPDVRGEFVVVATAFGVPLWRWRPELAAQKEVQPQT